MERSQNDSTLPEPAISEIDRRLQDPKDLSPMKETDGVVCFDDRLGKMWVGNRISADLYFTICKVELALEVALEESQPAERVTALREQLEQLYETATNRELAPTWTNS